MRIQELETWLAGQISGTYHASNHKYERNCSMKISAVGYGNGIQACTPAAGRARAPRGTCFGKKLPPGNKEPVRRVSAADSPPFFERSRNARVVDVANAIPTHQFFDGRNGRTLTLGFVKIEERDR